MLTTLLPPTAGTARVGGYDVVKQGAEVRASIGAALQEAALDPNSPAASTCACNRAPGTAPRDRAKRAVELLERVGCPTPPTSRPRLLGRVKRRLDSRSR